MHSQIGCAKPILSATSRWRPRQCLFNPLDPLAWVLPLGAGKPSHSWLQWTDTSVTGSPTSIDEPEPGPRTYCVFLIGHDGTVGRANILDVQTDDEAKAIAARLPNGHGIDLWERARHLASYPPQNATYPERE